MSTGYIKPRNARIGDTRRQCRHFPQMCRINAHRLFARRALLRACKSNETRPLFPPDVTLTIHNGTFQSSPVTNFKIGEPPDFKVFAKSGKTPLLSICLNESFTPSTILPKARRDAFRPDVGQSAVRALTGSFLSPLDTDVDADLCSARSMCSDRRCSMTATGNNLHRGL